MQKETAIESIWPDWEIESEIGAGAYGKVYKMRKQDIGGTYYAAVKVISIPQSNEEIEALRGAGMDDPQITAYYKREANHLTREFSFMERLKGHSNIVSYEDHKIVAHEDGFGWDVYIRMELLVSLSEYLKTKQMEESDAIQLGIDICNALELCEAEGIIHRDVKPGNIFVTSHGNYKLGDFSIASPINSTVTAVSQRGTYGFMAPEIYYGKPFDGSIDTYSLGLILYRLLNYGRAPFLPLPPEPITPEMMEKADRQRLKGEVIPLPANASPEMARVVSLACAFDASERYASAKAMKASLMSCLESESCVTAQLAPSRKEAPSHKEKGTAMYQFFSEAGDL